MGSQILHSRKSQLSLLVDACAHNAPAELSSRKPGTPPENATFAFAERDGLLLDCGEEIALQIETPGNPVQVRFQQDGRWYVFSAVSQGRVCRNLPNGGAAALLKLSLPLTIEPARKRRHVRVKLHDESALFAVFTHVVDEGRSFRARITSVSEGGISSTAHTSHLTHLRPGDLFWFSLDAHGEHPVAPFAVRLVHVRPIRGSDQLVMGWALQPAENALQVTDCVSQLAKLAASSRRGG